MLSPEESADLQALVLRCAHGDRDAWDELVNRIRPGLVRALHRRLHDSTLAEDLAQDTLLWLLLHADRLPKYLAGRADLATFLALIATRRYYQRLRRQH